MEISKLQKYLENLKGQYSQIEKEINSSQNALAKSKRRLERYEQAREIIKEVGLKTQEQLQFHISDITSMALETVFGEEAYKLEIEFVQRRNKTECDIYFTRNGKRINPKDASGVGTIDVAAFALRIASWSLQRPHPNNTIILDEPMKFLSEKYIEDASKMIKKISKVLGIQFIIVTHIKELSRYADKLFTVKIKKGISQVTSQLQELL